MNAQLAGTFDKPTPIYQQVTARIRRLIREGELATGERLPSTQALARQWQTNAKTVHQGLTPLVKEGLLVRMPKRGTFVRQREAKLTCVGVFDGVVVNTSLYLQALHKALQEELWQAGIEMDVWLDPRPEEQFAEPWPAFLKAAANREFQAVIVAWTNLMHLSWQTKLPVPTTFHAAGEGIPNGVDFDMKQFVDLSLQTLANQGCRSVGLITPLQVYSIEDKQAPPPRFFDCFTSVSRDRGLTIRNEWMRVAPPEYKGLGANADTFGYQQFRELWRQQSRPEGLVVHDDVTARGVITALLEESVRVPEDLKLVLHKNESIDLLCPVPATFLVSSEREVARALIHQVQKQFRGERCEPILVQFRPMAHHGNTHP